MEGSGPGVRAQAPCVRRRVTPCPVLPSSERPVSTSELWVQDHPRVGGRVMAPSLSSGAPALGAQQHGAGGSASPGLRSLGCALPTLTRAPVPARSGRGLFTPAAGASGTKCPPADIGMRPSALAIGTQVPPSPATAWVVLPTIPGMKTLTLSPPSCRAHPATRTHSDSGRHSRNASLGPAHGHLPGHTQTLPKAAAAEPRAPGREGDTRK